MENTVSVVGGPALLDDNQDWTDPLIGARWMWGFGVGSDLSWHALGLVE